MDDATIRLSAIDLNHPAFFLDGALALERLGYHRYWATEHHSPLQSANPALMLAAAGPVTSRIRLGTAAVLINLYPVLKIVEDVSLLAVLCGARRLDVGVTSAVPPPALLEQFLGGAPPPDHDAFAARVAKLVRLIRDEPLGWLDLPGGSAAPELWVCGQGVRSAQLAGALGVRYAFHHHQHVNAGADLESGRAIVDAFRASADAVHRPAQASVVCFGFCAESEREARARWSAIFDKLELAGVGGADVRNRMPSFLGDARQCREQLLEIADGYGVSELVLGCIASTHEQRLRSYELLADAFHLEAIEAPADASAAPCR